MRTIHETRSWLAIKTQEQSHKVRSIVITDNFQQNQNTCLFQWTHDLRWTPRTWFEHLIYVLLRQSLYWNVSVTDTDSEHVSTTFLYMSVSKIFQGYPRNIIKLWSITFYLISKTGITFKLCFRLKKKA